MLPLLEYALWAFIIGGLVGLVIDYKASTKASSFMAAIGALLLLGEVYQVYTSGPWKGTVLGIPVHVDGLSAVFLFIVGIVSLASAIYSISYMDHHEKKGKGWVYAVAYNTFIASMALVVTVSNLEYFVVSWELMTLSSFILIFWKEERKDLDASLKYYLTMHFADTIPLFLLLGLASVLTGSVHNLSYPAIHNALLTASSSTKFLFYALTLSVFISKAGVVPLHFWLPDAHPAAPSNVSALLSGIMIKTAVYGLLRFDWQMVGQSVGLGYLVAVLGAVTLTVGTLYALRETNAKRLLAYHSVGQMGYIWLGIGIGMVLIPKGGALGAIGALGMFAGLFHAINHAIFKGSLFLEAGAVEYATGTVELNELGGLGSRMKVTALATLFSSMAIAGIPPFNGFISKWLIYVAGYQSGNFVLSLGAVLAALISAATLASFVKFYGAQFGGEMERYKEVKEVPSVMQLGEWILAGLTLFIGIFPGFVVGFLNKGLSAANGGTTATVTSNLYKIGFGSVLFSPVLFVIVAGVLAFGFYLAFKPEYGKEAKPWDCGSTQIDEDEYRVNAEGIYIKYEEKIGSFYRFSDWFYAVGAGIIHYIVRAYLWMGSYFTKIVDTPYTKVEHLDDLREREILYIDEEIFRPLVRFLRIAKDVVPGIKLGTFVVIALIVVGAIMGILAVL
ncbi:proton-conducting transporter membrane subunit [Thermococcus sp. Bubb.Bath]|uniref:proton-conducting transporter transmembrane domain-containing protein n=1 Tax=Thermococcus sp. Bubb.Bath TaxID=1638242 RepID=UPI00143BA492|nr:proton-conducting transporter membrane subunit [Thermococcus sp. Bubb.Bath]NJF25798.1 hydrogenase [Thermococcus sp. Bubb.Bath]